MRKIQIAISSDLCGQQQRLRGWSRMVVKQFQDGGLPPFWESKYVQISVKNDPIFMKFCTQQQILNWIKWTSRDQKWKSCIGQTPSSTERISIIFWWIKIYIYISCLRNESTRWSEGRRLNLWTSTCYLIAVSHVWWTTGSICNTRKATMVSQGEQMNGENKCLSHRFRLAGCSNNAICFQLLTYLTAVSSMWY